MNSPRQFQIISRLSGTQSNVIFYFIIIKPLRIAIYRNFRIFLIFFHSQPKYSPHIMIFAARLTIYRFFGFFSAVSFLQKQRLVSLHGKNILRKCYTVPSSAFCQRADLFHMDCLYLSQKLFQAPEYCLLPHHWMHSRPCIQGDLISVVFFSDAFSAPAQKLPV